MDLGLRGKNVLITGASGGIGTGICEVFAEEGSNIVAVDINGNAVRTLAARLEKDYEIKVIPVELDLGSEKQIVDMFELLDTELEGLDIVVNNAAYLPRNMFSPVDEFDVELLQKMSDVTLKGSLVIIREFVKRAKLRKTGAIMNFLSKNMFWPNTAYNVYYSTVKGGAFAYTRALAHELAHDGIRVNAIIPGYVWNPALDIEKDEVQRAIYERKLSVMPMGRWATPKEIGYAVAFICSEKGILANGEIYDATGGNLVGDTQGGQNSYYNN